MIRAIHLFSHDEIDIVKGVSNINNNETQIPDSVLSVETTMVRIIYKHVRQKTKFAQNARNADTLQKFAVLQT